MVIDAHFNAALGSVSFALGLLFVLTANPRGDLSPVRAKARPV
jgi:hypothetical protein